MPHRSRIYIRTIYMYTPRQSKPPGASDNRRMNDALCTNPACIARGKHGSPITHAPARGPWCIGLILKYSRRRIVGSRNMRALAPSASEIPRRFRRRRRGGRDIYIRGRVLRGCIELLGERKNSARVFRLRVRWLSFFLDGAVVNGTFSYTE